MVIEHKWVRPISDKCNWAEWTEGTGSTTNFIRIGTDAENVRELGEDPWGNTVVLWKCVPNTGYDADGGWNCNNMTIDLEQTYRLSCWYKRTGDNEGSTYLGTYGRNSVGTNTGIYYIDTGSLSTNPYFWSGDPPLDTWIMIVGFIRPNSWTGTVTSDESGRYYTTGKYANITRDFRWAEDNKMSTHRAYFYYSTIDTNRQYMVYPRFDLCDGSEPSIQELLNGIDSRNYDYIKSLDGDYSNVGIDRYGELHTNELVEIGPFYGLTNYYKLDEDAHDYVGNQNGTVSGATLTLGLMGNAYSFNGTTDYIDLGTSTNFNPEEVTVSALVYVDPADDTTEDWARIVQLGTSTGIHLRWRYSTDVFEGMTSWTVAGNKYNYSTTISSAGWYHVVIVADKTGYSAMYLNNTMTDSDDQSDDTITYGDTQAYIGGQTTSNNFKGVVDEVRIFNRRLTTAEIGQLYNIYMNEIPMQFDKAGKVILRGQYIEV